MFGMVAAMRNVYVIAIIIIFSLTRTYHSTSPLNFGFDRDYYDGVAAAAGVTACSRLTVLQADPVTA